MIYIFHNITILYYLFYYLSWAKKGQIYKYNQYQLSNLSVKTPVISSSDTQTSSAIELTTASFPSIRDKNKKIMFCIPKIPSRMMQASQIMTTYSLARRKKNKIIAFQPFQHLIIINNVLLPHPKLY